MSQETNQQNLNMVCLNLFSVSFREPQNYSYYIEPLMKCLKKYTKFYLQENI